MKATKARKVIKARKATKAKADLTATLYARSCVCAHLKKEVARMEEYAEELRDYAEETGDTHEMECYEEQARIYGKFLEMVETV